MHAQASEHFYCIEALVLMTCLSTCTSNVLHYVKCYHFRFRKKKILLENAFHASESLSLSCLNSSPALNSPW